MLAWLVAGSLVLTQAPPSGDRLAYLDELDPYHVHRDFPKLTTPQWVGEAGVEAVVVLAIDDMTNNAPKYEAFLRPILDRLKKIDGRAPVSVMTCRVPPDDPLVQTWLKEGVNLDVHTLAHPCPLLQKGDFFAARDTVDGCVDLLNKVPGNKPVAYRMPCCDSRNTVSPRFFAEVFDRPTAAGHFLGIDSSVFNILTPNDPALPRDLVREPDGRERFRKYLPFPSFVNTIEDYPYPYVIGRTCWEFPCVVPSDWEAQNLHKPNEPKTVEDLKAALDAIVLKRGVFNLVFHPHGWIKSDQIVELIDHAVARHGRKVKFLNFREAQERLNTHFLGGTTLRDARGLDNGVRVLDLNADGFQDVVIGNATTRATRLWDPRTNQWRVGPFPVQVAYDWKGGPERGTAVRFGVVRSDGLASMIARVDDAPDVPSGGWHFDGSRWVEDPKLVAVSTGDVVRGDRGVRLRDIDGDGACELLMCDARENAVFAWSRGGWVRRPFDLPAGAWLADRRVLATEDGKPVTREGRRVATAVRLVDLDEDGRLDVLFSDEWRSGVFLFDTNETGWSRRVIDVPATDPLALPKLVATLVDPAFGPVPSTRGMWVHSRHLWWQNEDTAALPDLVDRRSFNELLKDVEPRARSEEASLRSLKPRPGFVVERMASAPLVRDPIAFDWAADGALFVVEMGDYPAGLDGKGKPGGVVKRLVDDDGDGRLDRATVFLDGLDFPTGVMPWRAGVLVSAAPDVLYAEDRDGDGVADVREVLLNGFHPGNPQHRVNGFALGLDGWVHVANGDSGGTVKSLRTGKSIAIRGRDVRFRPDDGALEAESGQTQFGRQRDDWGDWFANNNSVWAWHYVIADHHLRRNPRLALTTPKQVVAPDRPLFPISRTLPRFNDLSHVNQVTSANCATPYRDDLFGPGFADNLFVSEPVHNLVRRVVLERQGATFRGRRAADEQDREFLASSDNWFRPTGMKTGPDGALWVADMYRAVIEHPEWIPDDWEKRLDLRAGADRGHIYRVRPVAATPRPFQRLDRLDTAGLVKALDHPNGWRRDTAMRLLMHRTDPAAISPLRALARDSSRPQARVQALATLDVLDAVRPEDLAAALKDPHAQVRRQALRSAAPRLRDQPALVKEVARLAQDEEAVVRFEAALALGESDDLEAGRALAEVLRRDGDDPWTRTAALSSAVPHAETILLTMLAQRRSEGLSTAIAGPLFGLVASGGKSKTLGALLDVIRRPDAQGRFADWQLAAALGLCEAARQTDAPATVPRQLTDLDPEGRLLAHAKALVPDLAADETARETAIRLLGLAPDDAAVRDVLGGALQPRASLLLQRAALASLARSQSGKVADTLINAWRSATPALRDALLDTLLARDVWVAGLLSSLEDGCLAPGEVGPVFRKRLTEHANETFRARALAVFGGPSEGRGEVLARYRSLAREPGDTLRGAEVFRKHCAACHRLGELGHEVGPDLTTVADRSFEAMLVAVFDPNRAVEARYLGFDVRTSDGRVISGLIASETGTSIALRRQEGVEDVLLRGDIDEMASTGRSLMPEGLEREVAPEDFRHLARFLAEMGPPRKVQPGNAPVLVRARDDGRVVLEAETAEIFGPTLVFERTYRNLGFWESPGDHAAWTFEVSRPGRFLVTLDAACDPGAAGKVLAIELDGQRLEATIPSTGSWDVYRRLPVGELDVGVGRKRLVARPGGPIRNALIDLRGIELRPR